MGLLHRNNLTHLQDVWSLREPRVGLAPLQRLPDGDGDPTAMNQDPFHLAKRCTSIREEHQAELAEYRVEGVLVVGERLCDAFLPSGARFQAFGYDEHPGIRIDASHGSLGTYARHHLSRARPFRTRPPAADHHRESGRQPRHARPIARTGLVRGALRKRSPPELPLRLQNSRPSPCRLAPQHWRPE